MCTVSGNSCSRRCGRIGAFVAVKYKYRQALVVGMTILVRLLPLRGGALGGKIPEARDAADRWLPMYDFSPTALWCGNRTLIHDLLITNLFSYPS